MFFAGVWAIFGAIAEPYNLNETIDSIDQIPCRPVDGNRVKNRYVNLQNRCSTTEVKWQNPANMSPGPHPPAGIDATDVVAAAIVWLRYVIASRNHVCRFTPSRR